MNWQELNELDLSNAGDWPMVVKLIVVLILGAGVIAGAYYLDIKDQYVALERIQRTEVDLRQEFENKQAKAVNLDAYRQQLAEMRESFGAMLRQLPDKTEVADLLVDVSQTGLGAGLEFELFQPTGEVPKDFYAELPIKIRVTGAYHEFGEFISGLASLPRIVTIHDVRIKPVGGRGQKQGGGAAALALDATVKTYRYLDEEGG
jgi:type IV pilus assembly protein PilO